MTVLLDKKLTARQQWALEYLSDKGWVPGVTAFDGGDKFVWAYSEKFGIKDNVAAQRSLARVLRPLEPMGLIEIGKAWGSRTYYPDCGPTHCNEYRITSRGKRAAISHDTYD